MQRIILKSITRPAHSILLVPFIILFVASSNKSFSQVKPTDPDINQQQQLENAAQNATEDADLTELVEQRQYYASHPLDINKATNEELAESGFLNELQIQA